MEGTFEKRSWKSWIPESRRGRASLFILSTAAIGLFFPSSDSHGPEFLKRLGDAFHLPLFIAVAWCLVQLLSGKRSRIQIALFALLLASAVELLQPLVGRECSWIDLRNGLLGIILGTFFPLPFATRIRMLRFVAITLASSIFVTLPAWTALQRELWQRNHFPILADFEDPLQLDSWQSESSPKEAPARFALTSFTSSNGSRSLQMSFAAGSWSSVCFSASDRDWSAYRALAFDIRADINPFALHLRIDDDGDVEQFDSRFNRVLPLQLNWMRSEIPIEQIALGSGGRTLNLRAIRRICFFTGAEKIPQQAYLDNLRLVN